MKIKQIKLSNIGSYENEHVFSFNIDNPQKNIVLIGGRNGAGKTTLFDSVRLCLYGYKLYGYRQNSQVYINKVKRLINDNAKKKENMVASISLQIIMEDGYDNNTFEIERSWMLKGNGLKENYFVYKDAELLSSDERNDFDNFLLQVIPPALFDFHFFNGETISTVLFDGVGGQEFRQAFMQLCGLDTFDLIEDQLNSNIFAQKDKKSSDIQSVYNIEKKKLTTMSANYQKTSEYVLEIQKQIDDLEDQMAILDKKMEQYGGVEEKEWLNYQEEIRKEESKREKARNFLKDVANNEIPFIIMKQKLLNLKGQLIIEERLKKNRLYKEKLFDARVQFALNEKLKPYLSGDRTQLPNDFFEALYDVIREEYSEGKKELLFFSESESMDLLAKINKYINYDVQNIVNAEMEIETSLDRVKQLRAEMDSKEVIDSGSYLVQKNGLLTNIDKFRQELYKAKIELIYNEEKLKSAEQAYNKAYESFKGMLKEKSVTDMSARAVLAFNELKQQLYEKYIFLTEKLFALNFNQLISKTDLIDGIYISSSFEVIAYKQTEVDINNILDQVKEYGEEYVKDTVGERAIEMIKESGHNFGYISVPMKVEQHFSAGEQQIFVMALYQSLTAIRQMELPFIIDTPLARIDSEHRRNILRYFFAELPGQVIILSTDEEIDREGIFILRDKISDMYLIEHQPGGTSRVNKDIYFKGERN